MLANGMGGIDWQGLEFAVALYGVTDVDALIADLLVIKNHTKPDEEKDD